MDDRVIMRHEKATISIRDRCFISCNKYRLEDYSCLTQYIIMKDNSECKK